MYETMCLCGSEFSSRRQEFVFLFSHIEGTLGLIRKEGGRRVSEIVIRTCLLNVNLHQSCSTGI